MEKGSGRGEGGRARSFGRSVGGIRGSAGRADCLPRGKPPCLHHGQQLCRRNSPLMGIDAPTRRGERACSPMERSIASGGDPKGTGGERKAPLLAPQRETSAEEVPLWRGLTRRLRRELGLAVPWGAHTFLSVAKEKCAKESQRHGATEKRLLLPILTAGLAMSRAMELDSYYTGAERARARLFPPSK